MAAIAQPQWYSEADFERVEAEREVWRSLRQSEAWPLLAAHVEGMLFGWRRSLETLEIKDVVRVQGMIAGARAVLALVEGRIQEKDEIIAGMEQENDKRSASRTDQEEGTD